MLRNILICLQYDGSRYSGWQRQGNTDNTIEDKITTCLKYMCDQDIELHGSGRTDMGVHARGQTANFHIDTDMSVEDIRNYLNEYLPEDIRVLWARDVDSRFHSRLSAKTKSYVYTIDNGDKPDVFFRKYTWHYPGELDVDKMRKATNILIGEHDFRSFSDMKTKKSSVRNIYNITITQKDDFISIEYVGDGFLYHMVRKLTAALVDVGVGRLLDCDIRDILEKKDRQAYKGLAVAKGLCLKEVTY